MENELQEQLKEIQEQLKELANDENVTIKGDTYILHLDENTEYGIIKRISHKGESIVYGYKLSRDDKRPDEELDSIYGDKVKEFRNKVFKIVMNS